MNTPGGTVPRIAAALEWFAVSASEKKREE
jgi:hypothetical protein